MRWVLLWVVLVVLAVTLLGWLAWGVVRKALALGHELANSAALVAPALQQPPEPYVPASSVLSDADAASQAHAGRARAGHRRARAGHRRLSAADFRPASGRVR